MFTKFEDAYEETIRCIRCGYCLTTCPTYQISSTEADVARGRNFLTRLIFEQQSEINKKSKNIFYECLLCGACIDNCAPNVNTPYIMMSTRNEIIKREGQPKIQKFVFKKLLLNPKRFTRIMKMAALGKRTRVSNLAQALKIFSWMGKNVATMEDLLETLPKKFFREQIEEIPAKQANSSIKVGYFVGCGINFAFPEVGIATVNVLRKSNFRVEVLENYCCGLPAAGYGDLETARELARRNIEIFENSHCDVIISECGSCSSFLSEYAELLKYDEHFKERAEKISAKIQDINVFLAQNNVVERANLSQEISVTYHDPCHLSHYMKITKQPRELIQQIKGIHFKELPEANWCCGGAGTYNVAHPDLSKQILQRKMNNVTQTKSSILLTSCPGCMVQLAYGARKFNIPVKVKHLVQIIDESIDD